MASEVSFKYTSLDVRFVYFYPKAIWGQAAQSAAWGIRQGERALLPLLPDTTGCTTASILKRPPAPLSEEAGATKPGASLTEGTEEGKWNWGEEGGSAHISDLEPHWVSNCPYC